MMRRFSAADLDALRQWEFRQEHAADEELGAQSMLDYGDCEDEVEPAIVQVALDLSKLQIETTHKRATSFESLPVFQRSRVDVAQDGGFTIRKRNPELDIKTDYVPIYLSDSVTNLSGVKIPLPPQRAVDVEDSSVGLAVNTMVGSRRALPTFKQVPDRVRRGADKIYTDEAWVMRNNAARNAQKINGESVSPPGSLRNLLGSVLSKPRKEATWYDRLSQSQILNGSELNLNLSVMAWDSQHVLPGEVQAPNEHCRVVSVRGEPSPAFRRRRTNGKNVRVRALPAQVESTWSAWEYDRTPQMQKGFTLEDLIQMRNEMILYKVKEMQVHPASRKNTHIYRKENFGLK